MLATLYRDRRTGVFYVNYRVDGKRVRESTQTKNERIARQILSMREKELVLGTLDMSRRIVEAVLDPGRQEAVTEALHLRPITPLQIEDALAGYREHSKVYKSLRHVETDLMVLRKAFRLLPQIKVLNDLKSEHVVQLLNKLQADGAAEKTRINWRGSLHALFCWAKENGHVAENPVSKVPKPKLQAWDVVFLESHEIQKALNAVEGDPIEPLFATALFAGLRREELTLLTWEDVDLRREVIRVRTKLVEGEARGSKTRKNRTVPLFPELARFLARLPLPHIGVMFKAPMGGAWHSQLAGLSDRVKTLLEPVVGAGKASLQVARHSFVTHRLREGWPPADVARWAGHSLEVLMRHYAGFVEEGYSDLMRRHIVTRKEVSEGGP